MQAYKFFRKLLFFGLASLLAACGGGGSTGGGGSVPGGGSSPLVLSGQVADGYLDGARVFLDRNENRILDAGEPWAYSGAGGYFSLNVESGDGNLYPLVVDVVAGQTVDEDQPGSYVSDGYQLEAPAGHWQFVSPLTTLVKNEQDRNPDLSLQDAEGRVRSQLGFSSGVSFFSNYIENQGNVELDGAHRAARIVAALMGSLQTRIAQNIDSVAIEQQHGAIDLMISDQVVSHFAEIAAGVAGATDTTAVEAVRDAVLAAIDTSGLDAQLLARYVERMQYSDPVWDLTPPQVVAQTPQSAGNASTDVVVSLRFDEALDPASVSADSVQLVGPTGVVSGAVSYDSVLKQLSFTPDQNLLAYSTYQIAVNGVADLHGNPLPQTYNWDFTTIFDQLPPALPNF